MKIQAILSIFLSYRLVCHAFWSSNKKKTEITENSSIKSSPSFHVAPVDVPVDLTFPTSLSTEKDADIVASGFISATIIDGDIPFLFKTISRRDQPSYPCQTLEFINLPSPNSSPFYGGSVFKLIKELYNDKFAWFNGKEYLSFIANGDHGTWLVGVDPGHDSGYVYLKPTSESLVPIADKEVGSHWHWLMESKWIEQPDVAMICHDAIAPAIQDQKFYKIEYFDIEKNSPQYSYFIPGNTISPHDGVDGMYYDVLQKKWTSLKNLHMIASMGQPNLIRDSNKSPVAIAHLVNEEHGSVGWRLTYRYAIGFNKSKNEISVIYDRFGPKNGISIARLSSSQLQAYMTNMHNTLSTVSVGDYIWLWYSIDAKYGDDMRIADISSGYKTERHDEMLLECIKVAGDHAVFAYHGSDRIQTMKRSILSIDTNFIMMNRQASSKRVIFTIHDIELTIHGAYNIGSDIISFIKSYLSEKEGTLGGMSSCYMYHAAVSLPRPLVYAAEIICVLLGSKPLTMIQYVTPSDHQWKFPLVAKLTQHIITSSILYPHLIDVNTTVTSLMYDKTLIIYRPNRQYLVDALRPYGEAQALHPGPYPDQNNLRYSLKQQIYNAWWNGYILGYPVSFIDSYCMSFHSELSREEKAEQVALARQDIERYFQDHKLQPIKIAVGLDPPVHDIIWSTL